MDLNFLRLTYFLILKNRELDLSSSMERSLTRYRQLRFVLIFTLMYLTLLVGCILVPHNFIFQSSSNLFCLDLKITNFSFFTLSEILFGFNQLTRYFRSALTILFSFLIELLRHDRLVS